MNCLMLKNWVHNVTGINCICFSVVNNLVTIFEYLHDVSEVYVVPCLVLFKKMVND